MFRIIMALITLAVFTGAVSCGTNAPAGPKEIAIKMFEAAQAGEYDEMMSYMSPEMQMDINEAALSGIEIISFTTGEIEYSNDSTEVELDYTITMKNIRTGDTEVETDDMDMIRTSDGQWIIIDM